MSAVTSSIFDRTALQIVLFPINEFPTVDDRVANALPLAGSPVIIEFNSVSDDAVLVMELNILPVAI